MYTTGYQMANVNTPYTIEKAKDGRPTLRVRAGERDILIHSAYQPLADSRALEGSFNPAKYDILVVLGAGLGYHLLALELIAERYRRIIIIDALPGLDVEIARIPETSFLAARGNISLLTGLPVPNADSVLDPLLALDGGKGIQVLEHPQSVRANPGYYRDIRAVIERLVNRKTGDMVTRSALGLRFFKNAVANLASLAMHRPSRALAGRFAGLPALVATSGPTLSKNLAAIREHRRRFIIIAVDSALPVLLHGGIDPDFCVSIDPQPYILEHFLRAAGSAAIPLLAMTSERRVFRMRPGFVSLNTHPVSQFLEEAFPGVIGSFNSSTGTVAGDAVQAALVMGFGAIGLAGFDFSFPGLEIYSRGSAYQERYAAIFQSRFNPVETQNLNYIMKSSGGVMTGALYSRKSFLRYRESLEDLVLSKSGGMIHAIAPAGAPLGHVSVASLDEFIDRHAGTDIDMKTIMHDTMSLTATLRELVPFAAISRLMDGDLVDHLAAASLGEGSSRLRKAADFLRAALREVS